MAPVRYEELTAAMTWWRASHNHRLLSADEEAALGRCAQAGDVAARNDLVVHNVRLAISVARQPCYAGRGLSLDDLIQHAIIGVITAAGKFDPDRGLKFSTYATYWARQAVDRALTNYGTAVRIPAHMDARIARVARAAADYAADHGEEADDATLAGIVGITVEQLQAAREAMRLQRHMSLDAPRDIGEGVSRASTEELTLADIIADPAADPCEAAEATDLSSVLRAALARLPRRHRDVVALRYGLDDNQPRTLAEIGAALGVTRQRAEQIHAEAMRELRGRHELRELLAA